VKRKMSEERYDIISFLYELADALGYNVVQKKPAVETEWNKEIRQRQEHIKELSEKYDVPTLVNMIKTVRKEIEGLKKLMDEQEEKIKEQCYEKLAEYEKLLLEVYNEYKLFPTLIRRYRDKDGRMYIKVNLTELNEKLNDLYTDLSDLYSALEHRLLRELNVKSVEDDRGIIRITV
jgi:MoaA/NifB/PqqE/SkfB family radical SAM enzyme